MPIITCTHCGAAGNAPDEILGQTVRCSKCKQSFVAAVAEAALAEPAEEDDDGGFPTNEDIARPPSNRRTSDRDDEPAPAPAPVRPKRPPADPGAIYDVLMFRRMVAPTLIIIMFWFLLAVSIVLALATVVMGLTAGTAGIGVVLGGLIYLVIGPIAVRLWCEISIVVFRMNETLVEIRDRLGKDKAE